MHIHSSFSPDSDIRPRRIFDRALDLGLRGVAITDHNELTQIESPFSEVIAIPGMEVYIEEYQADIIGLGLTRAVNRGSTFKEAVTEIKSQGGIVIVPHVFSSSYNYPALGEKIFEVAEFIDGIDITSPKQHVNNFRARKTAETLGKAKLGSSDAHSEEDIGRAVTVVQRPINSVKDLLDQIRMKRTKAKVLR